MTNEPEILEVGLRRQPVNRRLILVIVASLLLAVILVTGIFAIPHLKAQYATLSEADVRTVLAGIDLDDKKLATPRIELSEHPLPPCTRYGIIVPSLEDRPAVVRLSGRRDLRPMQVWGVIFENPRGAGELLARSRRTAESCVREEGGDRDIEVMPGSPLDRRLSLAVLRPSDGSGPRQLDRVTMLRYGNVITYVIATMLPTSDDPTGGVVRDLDRGYAEL